MSAYNFYITRITRNKDTRALYRQRGSKNVFILRAFSILLCFMLFDALAVYSDAAILNIANPICGSWRTYIGPSIEPDETKGFRSVSATSPENIWMVGSAKSFFGLFAVSNTKPLIYHWNGSNLAGYNVVGLDEERDYVLKKVVSLSQTDAWAVGYSYLAPEERRAYMAHWNGESWNSVKLPYVLEQTVSEITSLSMANAQIGWIVGSFNKDGKAQPFIIKWQNGYWKIDSTIHVPDTSRFSAILAVSQKDVWAVGSEGDGKGGSKPLILYWNGDNWRSQEITGQIKGTELKAIAAASNKDVWAVGWDSKQGRTVLAHWNGIMWVSWPTYYSTPLSGVSYADKSVWAVGGTYDTSEPVVYRWNGISWNVIPSPTPLSQNYFFDVYGDQQGGVWAAGYAFNSEDLPYSGFVAHFVPSECKKLIDLHR